MKILYLLPIILLSGCFGNKAIIKNVVKPPEQIMKDCQEYIKPTVGTPEELLKVIIENKKVYALCNNQNQAKKEYIERQNIK